MARYILFPIETDVEDLLADVYAFLQNRYPTWEPIDTALDTALAEAFAAQAADVKDLASQVPDSIFRYFGATLMGVVPQAAVSASTTSTWFLSDALGHTIPAGTQVYIVDSEGNRIAFVTLADVVVAPGATSTAVGGVALTAVLPGTSANAIGSAGGVVTLIDPLAWVDHITMVAATSGGLDDEDDDAYLNRLTANLQLLTPRPILPNDFSELARNLPGVFRATALDGYNPLHNLLTLNEASAETDASGWTNGGNTTVGSSGAQALDGAKSVSMTAIAGADMSLTGANSKAVSPGDQITVVASVRANTTVRSTKVGIVWRDAADAVISTVYGAAANDSNSVWTTYTHTAVAPPLAVKARLIVTVVAPVATEVHYVDKFMVRRGTLTNWVAGGTPETGNDRTISVAGETNTGAALDAQHKTDLATYLDALREVNFLVYVIDATYNQIDVTYNVKARDGFSTTTIQTNVNEVINAYLNAITWGAPIDDPLEWENWKTIRYLSLASEIRSVSGVDYIISLTLGIHGGALSNTDVTMGGAAPLPVVNTITPTVTA